MVPGGLFGPDDEADVSQFLVLEHLRMLYSHTGGHLHRFKGSSKSVPQKLKCLLDSHGIGGFLDRSGAENKPI